MTTTYAKRESVFDEADHVWRIDPEALVWTRPSGASLTVLWRDVVAVRAAFAPTKWKSWRHLIEIITRQGQHLLIDNAHFRGVGDFEDRSAAFAPFARGCIDRIAVLAPQAKARTGASPASYLGQLVFMMGGLALLTFILIVIPAPLGILILVKLLLILVSIPTAIFWAIRSRPRNTVLSVAGMKAGLPATGAP